MQGLIFPQKSLCDESRNTQTIFRTKYVINNLGILMRVSNELKFRATRILPIKFNFISVFCCILFWSYVLYCAKEFKFGAIFSMTEPEQFSMCHDHLSCEVMVVKKKILDLAVVILQQYRNIFMIFMHVIQDLPASSQPRATTR